jgi:selenium metabolism protein YedF
MVVLIDSETVGRGDDDLGRILMGSFLHTLLNLTPLPRSIILLNGGVRLAAEGSDFTKVLSALSDAGVDVLSCGTCLDFFQLKEKLMAGRVSTMAEIVSALATAPKVIKP